MVNGSKGGFYIVGNRHGNNAETEVATVGPTLSKSAEANARLIAAAPEMLTMLEQVAEGHALHSDIIDLIEKIRGAA